MAMTWGGRGPARQGGVPIGRRKVAHSWLFTACLEQGVREALRGVLVWSSAGNP